MNLKDLKIIFGDEYPAAVMSETGIRMPLHRETRFSRFYYSAKHKNGAEISRFMDGTATITAAELQRDWASWPEKIRSDFCQSCVWLSGQADFSEMLRFITQNGSSPEWCAVALSVASELPRDEAFAFLVQALNQTEIGETANLTQAIAATKHPEAEAKLRRNLAAIWAHPDLWANEDHMNKVAYDAMTCIEHLIQLGVPPSDFAEQVRQLSEHVCPGNRDCVRTFLGKYYSWLN